MASGVPIVASDAGGIPEVIEDGRTGVVVRRGELHLLGERVLELLSWPEAKRRALTDAARAEVESRFGPDAEDASLRRLLARLGPQAHP